MKEVICLFEVFGDGDGIERFELVSVHKNEIEAELRACTILAENTNNERYNFNEEMAEAFNRPYFHMRREHYANKLYCVTEVGLSYGEFGGFVIEPFEIQ